MTNTKELKTLKDLELEKYPEESDMCSKEMLKQEAIKWIKKLEFINDNWVEHSQDIAIGEHTFDFYCCDCYTSEVQTWICDFFNITEEDLK